jgi:hypothetical protein|tara:strand:- start:132 stop:308 length:177 start_codon:yes stop_codon:yes gene_type:complete
MILLSKIHDGVAMTLGTTGFFSLALWPKLALTLLIFAALSKVCEALCEIKFSEIEKGT